LEQSLDRAAHLLIFQNIDYFETRGPRKLVHAITYLDLLRELIVSDLVETRKIMTDGVRDFTEYLLPNAVIMP
jgi:hypothetical protein